MSAVSVMNDADVGIEGALAKAQAEGIVANFGRFLAFLDHVDGQPIELQALKVMSTAWEASYYAHVGTLTEAVRLLDQAEKSFTCPALYVIANPIVEAVASRSELGKWHKAGKGDGTTDSEIAHRTVLFIDIDAKRPKGTSATDAQVAKTADVAARILDKLAEHDVGSESVGLGHSGNGRSVFVALDSLPPAESTPTIKGILAALAVMFSGDGVEIDRSVHDPKRLVPAFGTSKKKGAASNAERPHRRTAFVGRAVFRVTVVQLGALLDGLRADLDDAGRVEVDKAMGVKPARGPSPAGTATSDPSTTFGESPFARANAVAVGDVLAWAGLLDGDQPVCPGCGESDGSTVAVVGNGLKCSHARCAAKGRAGFRTPVDIVAEAKSVSPRGAVEAMADHFGFDGFGRTKASPASPPGAPREVGPTLVQRIANLGVVRARLSTGIPTLDTSTRGGLPVGRVVGIGGAPGAGKTMLLAQLAIRWALEGVAVCFLASDEEAEGILIRWGQALGFDLDKLESGDAETKAQLREALAALPLLLLDAEDEDPPITIEVASARLRELRGDRAASVLMGDSIQTLAVEGIADVDNPRGRIDLVMRAAKRAAKRDGHLVLVSSELARGSYRSKNAAEQINDLAAFKESGSIEYLVSAGLVLRSVEGSSNLVDVTVPKNRIGRGAHAKAPFRLVLDFARATLTETELPAGTPDKTCADRDQQLRRAVVHAVATNPKLHSRNQIIGAIRDAGQRFREKDALDLLKRMEEVDRVLARADKRSGYAIVLPAAVGGAASQGGDE